MIDNVNPITGSFDHHCDGKCERKAWRRRILARIKIVRIDDEAIPVVVCPLCKDEESLNTKLTAWEGGDAEHPKSLIGTTFPDTGGVVIEDSRFTPHPQRRAQARHIRALCRLAGVPVHEVNG